MTFSNMLYRLVLGPLELLFDAVYTFALRVVKSPGLSLVFLLLAEIHERLEVHHLRMACV